MVSAKCPLCTIYLVEANSNQWSDLEAAEKEAVALGATIVSNSYSGSGASQSDFDTKHVTYLASSGDGGYGIADPADFGSVVAVGGTRGWTETVWSGAGAGDSTSQNGGRTFWKAKNQKHLYPIPSGSDGSCGGSYLCT
ncbi:MAG: hypothetical protein WB615_13240, partial [Candidatus Tumulicola sp.]